MALTKDEIMQMLKEIKDPELDRDIVSLGMVKEVGVDANQVFVHLEINSPNVALKQKIKQAVETRLTALKQFKNIQVQISGGFQRGTAAAPEKQPLPGIQNIVAVASGKGGVGKTTAAVNLSYSLLQMGYKVGLMDGDIYGPNVPLMVGIPHTQRPGVSDNEKMVPIMAQGLKVISMGVLVPPDQPMVWRGPMLHSAVTQFLQKVEWGELDYLVVDLPPGTGDVQLSLVQSVPLSGAVVITTPQEVSLMDVRKAIVMFQKTHVPVLGILENMAGAVFGSGGGKKAAEEFKAPYLGSIPLDAKIREGGDAGRPIVLSSSESPAAQGFMKAAQGMINKIKETVPA